VEAAFAPPRRCASLWAAKQPARDGVIWEPVLKESEGEEPPQADP